jgi:hypothetical protein
MYILLEYVTCVVLVACVGAVLSGLLALGWACVALVQILYGIAVQIGRLLPRPSLAALELGRPLFKIGDNLVAVKVSTGEDRAGLVPLDRSGTGIPRDPW